MSSAAKRRGAEGEIWPVEQCWLHELEAERLRQAGREDEGDWWMKTIRQELYVNQSKAVRNFSVMAALRDAKRQAENFAKHRGLAEVPRHAVFLRPIGYGRASIEDWPFIQTFGQILERG